MRESQDNPGTACVTSAYRDTLPQGCLGVRESQDNPGTPVLLQRTGILVLGGEGSLRIILGLVVLLRHTGILWHRVRESQDNPGTACVTSEYWDTLAQGEGVPG